MLSISRGLDVRPLHRDVGLGWLRGKWFEGTSASARADGRYDCLDFAQ